MANQVEATKLNQLVGIGPSANAVAVPKLAMFVLLEPGSDAGDTSNKQGHVYSRIVRR
jgi:hypothetical protein